MVTYGQKICSESSTRKAVLRIMARFSSAVANTGD
jgi:hypothetical protein